MLEGKVGRASGCEAYAASLNAGNFCLMKSSLAFNFKFAICKCWEVMIKEMKIFNIYILGDISPRFFSVFLPKQIKTKFS